MRTLALLLPLLLGCQSRPNQDSPSTGSKTVEAPAPDDDFVMTRAALQRESRARLARIDTRLRALGSEASGELRVLRDQLALEIDEISQQGETAFDTFRAELDKGFDKVERRLGL